MISKACLIKIIKISLGFTLLFLFLLTPTFTADTVFAVSIDYKITDPIPGARVPRRGYVFKDITIDIPYETGSLIVSSNPDGTGDTIVDDRLILDVTHPDNTKSTNNYAYHVGCFYLQPRPPQNITYLFKPGINKVRARLSDACGGFYGSSSIYIVNTGLPDEGPEPFLELPWDYESKGLNFNEAATSINSFFDHQYPLLSTGILEEPSVQSNILNYLGPPQINRSYSSHDGYDYGRDAKVFFGDPVLAAAPGIATYMNSCGACGNAILIDHQNGFQTRYYHLQKEGLVSSTPGEEVSVTEGQQIGRDGATGNVWPKGEPGAHIHFMVIEDKNQDGDFDDNIPDGLVDPFGWQSKEIDPWEVFNFTYLGAERTGNRSYYLWKKKLDNLDVNLTSNGGIFNIGKFKFDFPQGATNQNLKMSFKTSPATQPSNSLISLGSTILANATDLSGNAVTTFHNAYTITVDFILADLERAKNDGISFYSSFDGIIWNKEPTIVDLINKKAITEVNHMSYFALMAERRDITPPITQAILNGDKGQENWFRSDVTLSLTAEDNEDGLGVDYILYRIEGSDWEEYQNPLIFKNEGHYKVEYYSVDKDENIEQFKTVEFEIDKTIPLTLLDASPKILWPPNNRMVEIKFDANASDNNLYIKKIIVDDEYDLIEPEFANFEGEIFLEASREGGDLEGRVYIIKVLAEDFAGNIGISFIEILVPHDQKSND